MTLTARHLTTTLVMFGVLTFATASQAQGIGQEAAPDRSGVFGGFELALAQTNIDPETDTNAPGLGAQVTFHVGYRFDWGLGLSLGAGGAAFGYTIAAPTGDIDAELGLDALDLSAWYFLDLNPTWSVHLRGGLAQTYASFNLIGAGFGGGPPGVPAPDASDGFGAVFSGGINAKLRSSLRFYGELHYRAMNIALKDVPGLEDDFSIFGLAIGVGWSP